MWDKHLRHRLRSRKYQIEQAVVECPEGLLGLAIREAGCQQEAFQIRQPPHLDHADGFGIGI